MIEPYVSLHLANLGMGRTRETHLHALVGWARRERPALLVLTGNVTCAAQLDEYERAQAFVDRLAVPRLLAVPGPRDLQSQDFFSRAVHPYGPFAHAFDVDAAPRLAGERVWMAGLSTPRWWLGRRGAISRAQASSAASWLADAPADRLKVLAQHHSLLPDGGCLGARGALARLEPAGVRLVLSTSVGLRGVVAWQGGVCHATSAGLSGIEPGFQSLRATTGGNWWLEQWRIAEGHCHYVSRVRIPVQLA